MHRPAPARLRTLAAVPPLVLAALALPVAALLLGGPPSAEAQPVAGPSGYVSGDAASLSVWIPSPAGPQVVIYTLGYADPVVGRGLLPHDEEVVAEEGSPLAPACVFRTDPSDGQGPWRIPTVGLVSVGGVSWEAGLGAFVSGNALFFTQWIVRDGDIVEARLHRCVVVPPQVESTSKIVEGRTWTEAHVVSPARTVSRVEVFQRPPAGRVLGWTPFEEVPTSEPKEPVPVPGTAPTPGVFPAPLPGPEPAPAPGPLAPEPAPVPAPTPAPVPPPVVPQEPPPSAPLEPAPAVPPAVPLR